MDYTDTADSLTRNLQPIGGAGSIDRHYHGAEKKQSQQETAEEKMARHKILFATALSSAKEQDKLEKSDGWKVIPYTGGKGIFAFEIPPSPSPHSDGNWIYTLKASGVVENKSTDSIARAHMDTNKISRLAWDTDISDIGMLEIVKEDQTAGMFLNVQWATVTPPSILSVFVSPREFVNVQFCRRQKGKHGNTWTIVSHHVDHPDRPITKDFVRGLGASLIVLRALAPERVEDSAMSIERTEVTIVGWLDPMGSLPAKVVEYYKTVLADRIKFLRTASFRTL